MFKKNVGFGLIILGLALLIVSLSADLIGIGNGTSIGWKQVVGAGVGLLIALGGTWLMQNKSR